MTAPLRVFVDPFDPDDVFLLTPDDVAWPLTFQQAVGIGDALLAAAHAPRPSTVRTAPCFVCGAPVPAHLIKCAGACSPRSVVAR